MQYISRAGLRKTGPLKGQERERQRTSTVDIFRTRNPRRQGQGRARTSIFEINVGTSGRQRPVEVWWLLHNYGIGNYRMLYTYCSIFPLFYVILMISSIVHPVDENWLYFHAVRTLLNVKIETPKKYNSNLFLSFSRFFVIFNIWKKFSI